MSLVSWPRRQKSLKISVNQSRAKSKSSKVLERRLRSLLRYRTNIVSSWNKFREASSNSRSRIITRFGILQLLSPLIAKQILPQASLMMLVNTNRSKTTRSLCQLPCLSKWSKSSSNLPKFSANWTLRLKSVADELTSTKLTRWRN